jgi:hypothetical protein
VALTAEKRTHSFWHLRYWVDSKPRHHTHTAAQCIRRDIVCLASNRGIGSESYISVRSNRTKHSRGPGNDEANLMQRRWRGWQSPSELNQPTQHFQFKSDTHSQPFRGMSRVECNASHNYHAKASCVRVHTQLALASASIWSPRTISNWSLHIEFFLSPNRTEHCSDAWCCAWHG